MKLLLTLGLWVMLSPDLTHLQNVTLTVYHAEVSQTDSTPLQPADPRFKIDEQAIICKCVIALSRDLISKYDYKYGDTIYYQLEGEKTIHFAIYRDKMNKRITNTIDLLVPKGVYYKKENVKLWKL